MRAEPSQHRDCVMSWPKALSGETDANLGCSLHLCIGNRDAFGGTYREEVRFDRFEHSCCPLLPRLKDPGTELAGIKSKRPAISLSGFWNRREEKLGTSVPNRSNNTA